MAIKYFLRKYYLIDNKDAMIARIEPNKILDNDAVIDEMMKRGTTVNRQDAMATINLYHQVLTDQILEGNNIRTSVTNFKPVITGIFSSNTDNFEAGRHSVQVSLSPGQALRHAISQAVVTKISKPYPHPQLIEYYDVNLKEINNRLTKACIGQINGADLKFNKSNVAEGIFFVDENGVEYRANEIQRCSPKMLVFLVPSEMLPGIYTLSVRKAYGKNALLRTGELLSKLTLTD